MGEGGGGRGVRGGDRGVKGGMSWGGGWGSEAKWEGGGVQFVRLRFHKQRDAEHTRDQLKSRR